MNESEIFCVNFGYGESEVRLNGGCVVDVFLTFIFPSHFFSLLLSLTALATMTIVFAIK